MRCSSSSPCAAADPEEPSRQGSHYRASSPSPCALGRVPAERVAVGVRATATSTICSVRRYLVRRRLKTERLGQVRKRHIELVGQVLMHNKGRQRVPGCPGELSLARNAAGGLRDPRRLRGRGGRSLEFQQLEQAGISKLLTPRSTTDSKRFFRNEPLGSMF